jgi:alpha-D-ribose 1-methylphosphonate 5-phosphate C-P lyase
MKLEILKWVATATLIVGFGLFSAGIEFGWYLQITGGLIWLTAAVIMKDKALMVTNGAMTTVGIIGKLFG